MQKIAFFIVVSFISVASMGQSASFTYQSVTGTFCNPDTVSFSSTSSGNPKGYLWSFGNGRSSNRRNPAIVYTTAGSYNVKLTVIYDNQTSVVTNTVVINPAINPAFSSDKNELCKPDVINFTATGGGSVASYDWNFGDGTGTTSTTTPDISHMFADYGSFTVTLSVRSIAGCTTASNMVVTVQKPEIVANVSAVEGCIPANIIYDATVTTVPGDAVSSYMWSFGDGSAPLSTGSNTTAHNYAATGIYAPSLTITTAGGCSNNFAFDTIRFGIPPTNIVAYPLKNTLCGSESATFIGKATNANTYIWDNTETIDIETDTISKHKFSSLGTKNIKVTPAFNGCLGVADSFDVTIIGVIAKFDLKNTCSDKKTFSFDGKSLGNISSYLWRFDDGSPDEIIADVVHTFPNTGEFSVSLTVDDDITGCSDTKTQKVYTAAPQLNSQDLSICINSSATFTVTDEYANPGSRYIWNVAGKKVGAGTKTSVTVKADKFGTFDNTVIITNGKAYCNDTIQMMSKTIVKGPMLGFTSQDSFCLSTPLIVTNTSKPYLPGDSIVSYIWNFGDGNRDSTFQPGPQEYSIPGRYTLRLEGTDINGCTDVFRKVIRISDDAFVYVLPRVDTLCLGQSDTLIAFQNDNITWSPANLTSCSTCDTITVSPPTTTMFYATSTNTFGCSAMDSVLVKVYNPFNATTATPDVYICLNDSVQIDAGPANYKIMWNPAGGLSDPNSYTPFAFPGVNTTYTATLSDSVGCFTSSADVNVHLKSLPGVDAGPDQVFPFNSPFTLMPVYGNNVVSYLWSPANQLNCTTCANALGTILKKETYTIAVTSDSGCVSKDEITIFVECKDSNVLLPNAFTPNNDNINDYFYPLTRGIDRVLNFAIYSREGKRVYHQENFPPNDKTFGWDGNVKGASPSTAVYVYILDVLCDSGERISKKGSVILIR